METHYSLCGPTNCVVSRLHFILTYVMNVDEEKQLSFAETTSSTEQTNDNTSMKPYDMT